MDVADLAPAWKSPCRARHSMRRTARSPVAGPRTLGDGACHSTVHDAQSPCVAPPPASAFASRLIRQRQVERHQAPDPRPRQRRQRPAIDAGVDHGEIERTQSRSRPCCCRSTSAPRALPGRCWARTCPAEAATVHANRPRRVAPDLPSSRRLEQRQPAPQPDFDHRLSGRPWAGCAG